MSQKGSLVLLPFGVVALNRFVTSRWASLSFSMYWKGVVAVALFHVDEIQHPYLIAHGLQQIPGVSGQLALGIKNHKGRVGLQQIGLTVKPGLTGTRTAHHQHIEIAPVAMAVQPQPHLLGQQDILAVLPLPVAAANALWISPLCAAMFLPIAGILPGGQGDSNCKAVDGKANGNCSSMEVETMVISKGMCHGLLQCCQDSG